ncbi:MAG: hypothetical protein U0V48_04675 [Anaerolineales bacterium]
MITMIVVTMPDFFHSRVSNRKDSQMTAVDAREIKMGRTSVAEST